MENLGQYILSVTITAMLCGMISALVPSESGRKWLKTICGMILTIAVVRPLSGMKDIDLTLWNSENWEEGAIFSSEGEKQSQQAMETIIKEQTEAYILDKAKDLGIMITPHVDLSQDQIPVPVSVELSGSVPSNKQVLLENWIQTDLGITKENMKWTE